MYPEIGHGVLLDSADGRYAAVAAMYRDAWETSSADRFKVTSSHGSDQRNARSEVRA
jgi:ABC-type sulfate transport system substrate-binding protein